MIEIREFKNADVPLLADLWCIHHATYRTQPPAVTHTIFEQAVASRLFFNPARLLVATENRHIVAWCQWFAGENHTATLAALCFHTNAVAVAAASDLLRRAEQNALAADMRQIQVGVPFDLGWGYQGLDPIGHGVGIDVADDRTNTLLEAYGYEETKRIDRWEATTADYRAPVNRDLLLMRRSSKVKREHIVIQQPRLAESMSQFEVERLSLADIHSGTVLGSIELWTSEPEAMVMPFGDAILGDWATPPATSQVAPSDIPIRYLISVVMPELAQRRIRSLHRSLTTDNTIDATTMISANFSRTSAGRVMAKRLTH